MKTELIFTFNSTGQQFVELPCTETDIADKQTFFEFATAQLSEEEKQDLVKISSCMNLSDDEDIDPPAWIIESNGKLWIDNGVLQ